MSGYQSLTHSKWDCKYHVIFILKRRKKKIYGELLGMLKVIFHDLARQKECTIIGGSLCSDHVHMCIMIPPKYSVASVIGFLKGKSAIAIVRKNEKARNRELSSKRVLNEHVIGKIKRFKIISDKYRNRRKRFGLSRTFQILRKMPPIGTFQKNFTSIFETYSS